MKFRLPILLSFLILSLLPSSLYAAGFQLKTVGALNVEGVTYTQLWYSNGNVTFTGIALENAEITATIDGTSETITADASGNWSYTASLADGDHQISFASNESTVSFTLTIGEVPANVGALPTAETPTVGIISPTLGLLLFGMFFLLSAFYFLKRSFLKA